MNQSVSNKAVCRPAPATLGLLNILWRIEFITKKMLPEIIFYWKLSEMGTVHKLDGVVSVDNRPSTV